MKKIIALIVAGLMIAATAACGQTSAPQAPEAPQETTGSGQAEASQEATGEAGEFDAFIDNFTEPVTLDVAMMWPLNSETDAKSFALNTALERLARDYPNITVNYDGSVHDDYQTIMMTRSAANSIPDVYNVKGSWLRNFIANNQIGTVDEFKALDPDWFNSMYDGCMFDMLVDGKHYGVPFQLITCTLVIYNTEIYSSVGYDEFPKTWDELIDCMTKLKDAGYVPIGVGNSGQWVANSTVFGSLGFYGGGIQWFNDIMNRTGNGFMDAGMLNGVDKMYELASLGFFNDNINSIDHNEVISPYLNEQYASYINGSWSLGTLIAVAGDDQSVVDKSGVATLPSFDGAIGPAPAASIGSGWGQAYSASLSPAEKYAAYLLIKYTTDEEWCQSLFEKGDFGAIVGNRDYSQSSPVVQKYVQAYQSWNAGPLYDCHFDPAVIDSMNMNFQDILANNITAEEWGRRVQAEYEIS
ncbi:MAG: extracellular solute-binding protein [Oscillospiraceae bacterium]|nr:extracellular solute-binding protein [Oscillospiraceae bacterium]